MNFNPLSDQELELTSKQLIPGITDFEVMDASHKTSKSGNPMIELKIKLFDKEGNTGVCADYLVGIDSCVWKISQFCKATNIEGEYKKGNLDPESLKGLSGKCETILEKYKTKNKDGNEIEGHSIKIKHYIISQKTEPKIVKAEEFDDDLPF